MNEDKQDFFVNIKNPGEGYSVGYKKPPKEHQFKKGQSGNPSGKRRQNVSPMEPFSTALNEMLPVTKGATRKRVKAHVFIARQIVAAAARGHLPSVKLALQAARAEKEQDVFDYSILTDAEIFELDRMLVKAKRT